MLERNFYRLIAYCIIELAHTFVVRNPVILKFSISGKFELTRDVFLRFLPSPSVFLLEGPRADKVNQVVFVNSRYFWNT